MILSLLTGCALSLGRPEVTYQQSEPLPLVRTTTDPRWFVPVEVEGDGLWAFFVDTGYSYTTCDDDLIEELGLETRGKVIVRGELGRLTTTKTLLPPMELGGHRIEGLVCQVRDLDRTSSIRDNDDVKIAGVIGMDIFRSFVVEMDPEQGLMHLKPRHTPISETTNPVRLRRESGFGIRTLVPAKIGGRVIWPVLDTGATGTHISGEKLGLTPSKVREGVTVRGTGGSGSDVRTILYYTIPSFALGSVAAAEVVATERRGRLRGGLLGLNVLSEYDATYDFDAKRAWFRPVTPRTLPTWPEWRSAERPPEHSKITRPTR